VFTEGEDIMANLFTGGADCSGGNAMTGLLKQYSQDRSLQQVRTTVEVL
jgi:hypothetical protein